MIKKPLPQQVKFLRSKKKVVIYSGSVGAGKTVALCLAALRQSLLYPRNFGVMVAYTSAMLRDTVLRTFFDVVPENIIRKYNRSEKLVSLEAYNPATGESATSDIIFRTAYSSSDWEKLSGLNLGWAGIDEAVLFSKELYKLLLTRLRLNTVPRRQLFMATNPSHTMHPLYVDFIEPALKGERKDVEVIMANTAGNIYLPDDYVETLESFLTGDFYMRYVKGVWGQAEGLIYPILANNIGDAPNTTADLYLYGVDWGTSDNHPAAIVVIGYYADRDEWWILDEFYAPALPYPAEVMGRKIEKVNVYAEEWAEKDMLSEYRRLTDKYAPGIVYADPSGRAGIEIWRRAGVSIKEANNSVMDGILFVASLQRKIFIDRKCINTIGEVQSYAWGKNGKPIKERDHAVDAMRYAFFSLYMDNPRLFYKGKKETVAVSAVASKIASIRNKKRLERIWKSKGRAY